MPATTTTTEAPVPIAAAADRDRLAVDVFDKAGRQGRQKAPHSFNLNRVRLSKLAFLSAEFHGTIFWDGFDKLPFNRWFESFIIGVF
jgi:hypothetical protein